MFRKRRQSRAKAKGRGVAGLRITDAHGKLIRFVDLREHVGPVLIGRAERCDVTIYDESVSRVHCRIEPGTKGRYAIVDEDSRNGVRIATLGPGDRRRRVTWEMLRLGSVVYLGDTRLIPVDEQIQAPIIAWRRSEFSRQARALYGSGSMLGRVVGFGQSLLARGERPQPRSDVSSEL
jgi:hypothetical protein